MKEKIICAAIYLDTGEKCHQQPKNISTGIVIAGLRHNNCIATIVILLKKNMSEIQTVAQEGFITSENRFVKREEAAKIALENGQVKELKYFKNKLDSSDLY